MPRQNHIPIEKLLSIEVEIGESIEETLHELVAVEARNWYLTDEEKKIVAESDNHDYDFNGMSSTDRNAILEDMKENKRKQSVDVIPLLLQPSLTPVEEDSDIEDDLDLWVARQKRKNVKIIN